MAGLVFAIATVFGFSSASAQITADINVKLKPVVENIPLVTDINEVNGSLYIATQPGLLLKKSLATRKTTDFTTFLDLRSNVGVGALGAGIPALPGLGYTEAGAYDERGLLGFVADPAFSSNGRFWVWYTAINENTREQPDFFQWVTSTSAPWHQTQYNHVGHLDEYRVVGGTPVFQRTVLKIKRPYFNHTGYQSLTWSPEHGTLMLGLGDGGSEYDPNNLAQDDDQLSGKLLKIDLAKLRDVDFRDSPPVATFTDLRDLRKPTVPAGAFTTLVKGMRNPSKVSFEQVDDSDGGTRWIKYLANTGQDTIEFAHAFKSYGINFGFRAWEGIFPTAFEVEIPTGLGAGEARVIAYGLEASRLRNPYRPFVQYTHLDEELGAHANTGSTLYRGDGIPGLKGHLVFTDWVSFNTDPPHGLLMHAVANRNNLQETRPVHLMNVDLSAAKKAGEPISYTSINTNADGDRIFVGGFKDIQFIVNQRNNPLGSAGLAGGVYEVVKD